MQFTYDEKATELTDLIIFHLRLFGYTKESEQITYQQRRFERSIVSYLSKIKGSLEKKDYEGVFGLFINLPNLDSSVCANMQTMQNLYRREPNKYDKQLYDFFEKLISNIETDYKVGIPFNVLSALNVLFELLVMPSRCYDKANETFEMVLGTNLFICDEDGTPVLGPDESGDLYSNAKSYWSLFDKVVNEWDHFGSFIEYIKGHTEVKEDNENILVIEKNKRMLSSALRVFFNIYNERNAA